MASSRQPQADDLKQTTSSRQPQADSLKHMASNKQDEVGRWPQAATTRDDLKYISDGLSQQPQADWRWPLADSLKQTASSR